MAIPRPELAERRIIVRRSYAKHREKRCRYQREKNQEYRCEAIAAYGGACVCCGETEPRLLTFDHIHNDGAEHRRKIYGGHGSGGVTLVKWLRSNGYPKDLVQVLCYNCNCSKGFYGECPHVTNSQTRTLKLVGGGG